MSREKVHNTHSGTHCTHSRIPHWQIQITVFRLFQQHRIWPLPERKTEKWQTPATKGHLAALHLVQGNSLAVPVAVLPFGKDQEELVDQRGRHGVGVELAGSGYQHGPRDSAQKAQHVGIDAATCSGNTTTIQVQVWVHDRWHVFFLILIRRVQMMQF